MTDDELGALLEAIVQLTPAERRRLLREAEALVAQRATTGTPGEPTPYVVPTPCPRCGLVPGPAETYCGRCGNRVAL